MNKDRLVPFWLQFIIITGILIFILLGLITLNLGNDNIQGFGYGIIAFIISGIGDLIYLKIHRNNQKL